MAMMIGLPTMLESLPRMKTQTTIILKTTRWPLMLEWLKMNERLRTSVILRMMLRMMLRKNGEPRTNELPRMTLRPKGSPRKDEMLTLISRTDRTLTMIVD